MLLLFCKYCRLRSSSQHARCSSLFHCYSFPPTISGRIVFRRMHEKRCLSTVEHVIRQQEAAKTSTSAGNRRSSSHRTFVNGNRKYSLPNVDDEISMFPSIVSDPRRLREFRCSLSRKCLPASTATTPAYNWLGWYSITVMRSLLLTSYRKLCEKYCRTTEYCSLFLTIISKR